MQNFCILLKKNKLKLTDSHYDAEFLHFEQDAEFLHLVQ